MFRSLFFVICFLFFAQAHAASLFPSELEPILQRLILHTPEGIRVAHLLIGREALLQENATARLIRALDRPSNRVLAEQFRERLERLDRLAPTGAADWIRTYRMFASAELLLAPGTPELRFQPGLEGNSQNYQVGRDHFLHGNAGSDTGAFINQLPPTLVDSYQHGNTIRLTLNEGTTIYGRVTTLSTIGTPEEILAPTFVITNASGPTTISAAAVTSAAPLTNLLLPAVNNSYRFGSEVRIVLRNGVALKGRITDFSANHMPYESHEPTIVIHGEEGRSVVSVRDIISASLE